MCIDRVKEGGREGEREERVTELKKREAKEVRESEREAKKK